MSSISDSFLCSGSYIQNVELPQPLPWKEVATALDRLRSCHPAAEPVESEETPTIRAPAVPPATLFDGYSPRKVTGREDGTLSRNLYQFYALAIQLGGQGTMHWLVGKSRTIS